MVRVMYCCSVICTIFDATVQRKILHAWPALGQAKKFEINWLAALFALTHEFRTVNLSGHIICGVFALMQVQSLHNTFQSSIMHSDRDAPRTPSVFTYSELNDSQVCIALPFSKPPPSVNFRFKGIE